MARQGGDRPERGRGRGPRLDESARRGHGGFLERWGADGRLRQQHSPGGPGRRARERIRLPGLCARLYPPALLQRYWPVSLGRFVG